jgi:hypothetical protein
MQELPDIASKWGFMDCNNPVSECLRMLAIAWHGQVKRFSDSSQKIDNSTTFFAFWNWDFVKKKVEKPKLCLCEYRVDLGP